MKKQEKNYLTKEEITKIVQREVDKSIKASQKNKKYLAQPMEVYLQKVPQNMMKDFVKKMINNLY